MKNEAKVVSRAVHVVRRNKRRVRKYRIGKRIVKYREPSASKFWSFKIKTNNKIKKRIMDPSWCKNCRGRKKPKKCVKLINQYNTSLISLPGPLCYSPKKCCDHCDRNLRMMSDFTARDHFRWCSREEPGIFIPGMKAYQMIYKTGREERKKFYELLKAKKIFKSNGKWYRRAS